MNIKVILLIPLLLLIVLMLPRFRRHAMSRLVMIIISFLGVLFILFPSLSNELAEYVGVGRGADLIIYLFMVFSFLYNIFMYAKLRMIRQDQTEIIKNIAIQNAKDNRKKDDFPR
ncbi:DUF2304 domain-containing protein [Pedobacter sp. Du54]|uniref:DUF2304 domain-containing protein n=1 Tax=Pedobacter anseongensis TaxID=3133439 RepID=UPI0030B610D4